MTATFRAVILTGAFVLIGARHATAADAIDDALRAIDTNARDWWGTEYEPPAYRVACVRQLAVTNPQSFRSALWNTRKEEKRLRSLALEVEAYRCIDAAQK